MLESAAAIGTAAVPERETLGTAPESASVASTTRFLEGTGSAVMWTVAEEAEETDPGAAATIKCFGRISEGWIWCDEPVESTEVADESCAETIFEEPRSETELDEQAEVEVDGALREPLMTCLRSKAAASAVADCSRLSVGIEASLASVDATGAAAMRWVSR